VCVVLCRVAKSRSSGAGLTHVDREIGRTDCVHVDEVARGRDVCISRWLRRLSALSRRCSVVQSYKACVVVKTRLPVDAILFDITTLTYFCV
jgi:hypothetical protein